MGKSKTSFEMGHQTWNKGFGKAGGRSMRIDGKIVKTAHYVWCNTSGNLPYAPKGFDIHHIDRNFKNNNPDNLFLISHSDHLKLHWAARKAGGN